ncbi:MAG TPA: imidazole glycerol phosphate synthase subunit HisH [Bacteroidia bacterium]|jgi:glutamine amidotransferase
MNIAVLKYNAGNIRSVLYALERVGAEGVVTDDPELIRSADKVIFPGVGEASSAMAYLKDRKLDGLIRSLEQPVLGICLGMQLMCEFSEEGDTKCLGLFDKRVKRFRGNKVPQVGWNNAYDLRSPLFDRVEENAFFYFVHSFFVEKGEYSIALTDYEGEFSSAIQKDNFFAVQFHPEKSGRAGEQVLKNFLAL